MACCVLAAFIITHICLFFRKGLNILLSPLGVQLKSDDALSGVQWSAYNTVQNETASHLLHRDTKYLAKHHSGTMFWMENIKNRYLSFPTQAYRWVAISLVLIELGVLGSLGLHFSQHGTSMAAMF